MSLCQPSRSQTPLFCVASHLASAGCVLFPKKKTMDAEEDATGRCSCRPCSHHATLCGREVGNKTDTNVRHDKGPPANTRLFNAKTREISQVNNSRFPTFLCTLPRDLPPSSPFVSALWK